MKPICDKIKYKTLEEAQAALKAHSHKDTNRKKKWKKTAQKFYRCPYCKCYHLTSRKKAKTLYHKQEKCKYKNWLK